MMVIPTEGPYKRTIQENTLYLPVAQVLGWKE